MSANTEQRKLAAIMFTDMVGSTQLKQELGDRDALALIQRHHGVVRELLRQFSQGEEISTAGDSFFLVFVNPSDAVRFALLLQARLRAVASQTARVVVDRIGIHVGEVFIEAGADATTPKDLHGIQVDTCSRVMALAQGNQILMTRLVFDNARQVLKGQDLEGVGPLAWLNHGPYLLKGVEEPLEVCEVGEAGKGALTPPANSEKARRHVTDDSEPVLGWRPALEQKVPGTEWILEKKLGEGGFGEVWLGRREKLKDRRVFKFCFRADRVRSLKREVTLFRLLKEKVGQHPNIVGIQEVFFDTPPFYIVMDYAEATDLRAWCEREGFENIPMETRLEIVAQVAEALQAAHEAGIIHRDVKPSNILVSNQKSEIRNQKLEAKLTDFGIGQVVSEEALAGLTKMGFTQTMMSPGSSSQTGTQLYMAPELLAGKPASTRSDIYSLGVVLYQLLIGDFSRPLTTDWAKRINSPLLREDLEKCFAGDPEERVITAIELAKNLRFLENRQFEQAERQAALVAQKSAARQARRIRTAGAAVFLVALITFLAVYAFRKDRRLPPRTKSIAVLPFSSPAKENQYFANQMSGELALKLSKIESLNVTPLVMASTHRGTSVGQIGRELSVETVILGTADKVADRIRLSVQVFDVSSQKLLLVTNYHRSFSEVFKIQSEVTRSVASALKMKVSVAENQNIENHPTDNFEAYDLYLKGKSLGSQEGEANNEAAIPLLQKAVELDQHFAEAWAELGHAYGVRIFYFHPDDGKALSDGLLAAAKALAKKPDLAAAHYARGFLAWTHANGFEHTDAIRAYALAIRFDPSFDEAHHFLGLVYLHLGLTAEARRECDVAIRINPNNSGAKLRRAGIFLYEGRFEDALNAFEREKDFNPSISSSGIAISQVYLRRTNEARATLDKFLSDPKFKDDKGGQATSIQAVLLALTGEPVQAEEKIMLARQRGQGFGHWHHGAHYIADAYALMNKPKEALESLKAAAKDGLPCYPAFHLDPFLQSLTNYPPFDLFMGDLKKQMEPYKSLDRELFPSSARQLP